MEQLNELELQIKNDDDLERWKSTWSPGQPVPASVERYMRVVIMPKLRQQARHAELVARGLIK